MVVLKAWPMVEKWVAWRAELRVDQKAALTACWMVVVWVGL